MVAGSLRVNMSVWPVRHILGHSEVAPFGPLENRFLVQKSYFVEACFSFMSREVNQYLEL